jgi:enamine deaminase RidA (YjgF/YER057c/UK114 family)
MRRIGAGETAKPSGAYSPAVAIGNIVAVSGQAGRGRDGVLPESLGEQVDATITNIEAALATLGASLDDVLHMRVYLTETAHFSAMNEVYAARFGTPAPARTTVFVGLGAGLLVEIDALAVLEGGSG